MSSVAANVSTGSIAIAIIGVVAVAAWLYGRHRHRRHQRQEQRAKDAPAKAQKAEKEAKATAERDVTTPQVIALGAGSVLIRNALDESTQKWLATYAMNMGNTAPGGGFWRRDANGDKLGLNATSGRGRIYQALSKYPNHEKITSLCLDLVTRAQTVAAKLPNMTPTHLLLLYYTSVDGMGWHRDSDKNDGDNNEPIVSISLGNSSVFGYKALMRPEESITINSGDVLIWGGPQRMLEHCVRGVQMESGPRFLRSIIGDARLNFTFRSAPNIIGHEDEFRSDTYWVDQ